MTHYVWMYDVFGCSVHTINTKTNHAVSMVIIKYLIASHLYNILDLLD